MSDYERMVLAAREVEKLRGTKFMQSMLYSTGDAQRFADVPAIRVVPLTARLMQVLGVY